LFVLYYLLSSVKNSFSSISKLEAIKMHLEHWLTKLLVIVLELRPFSLIGYWKKSKVHLTDSIGRGLKAIREATDTMCHNFSYTTLLEKGNKLLLSLYIFRPLKMYFIFLRREILKFF
jgi:hypothetical protein